MADTSSKSRELEQEAEIIPAIRHDDAEWKMIQQNTFTRWVNNHLKKANSSITNLENDFSDGLKLIELAMVLSQKKLGKFNKKVMFRSQKLENVSLALNFFQDAEKIKIVNIDSSHIVDKNKKLILGLIWTLILHYSISMGLITEKREGHPEETPKQKLLAWIRSKLPGGMPLTNFTSDWNDGVALGALVNALVPSACPDWETWHPANSLKNTEQAIKSAQEKLSIEPLITSAELIHPEIDEMSVMTYLSQFPTAKPVSSPAKSLPPPVAVPSVRGEFVGLEDFPTVHTPLEFAIQISEEGYRPKVSSQDPHGVDLHHTINKKNSQLYSVKCTPTKVGDHKFQLFLVDVATAETIPVEDETVVIKVLPSPRLMPFTDRVKLGDQIKFQVKDAFMGLVDIVIVDPESSEIHLPVLEEQSGLHSADYIPSIKGLHTVNAFYRKSRIEGSPFALHVHEKIPEYNIWGRGLRDIGVRVGDEVPICLTPIVPDQNSDDIQIAVSTAAGMTLPVTESNRLTPTRVFTYTPTTEGKHKIEVKTKDTLLGKSPYMVDVSPSTNSAVRAYGPGLRGGVANMPSVFEVLTNGQADSLSFSIEGPSKTTIQCSDKSDGVASVAYTPTEPGIYSVNVLAGGEHIQDSPFVLNVEPHDNSFQPGAVRITGLDSNTIHRTHQPVTFQIDSRRSGISNPVELVVFNNNLESIPVKITEKSPGMYDAEFTPSQPAKYHVDASLCGVAVPGAPFSITAKEPVDVSKLHMYGPGIEGPVYSQEPTHFTIDAKQAGTGVVEVSLDDRAGRAVDIDVLDNSDGSFTVKYTAPRPGAYQLNVVFAGEKIPPIQINVKPHFDTSGIHVDGLENGSALIGHRWNINVDTGLQRQKTQGLEVVAEVKEKEYLIPMTANDTKYAGVFVATEAGDLKFKVLFDNLLVKEFFANVSHGCDASKCRATGSGLTEGIVNVPATFKINTQGAGEGDLAVDIAGPSDTDSRIVDHEDRTCSVEFTPREPGTYTIDVMYGDKKHKIPGSPFNCKVDYPIDPSTVQVCGIDKPLRNRQPFDFVVDASRTKLGPVTCRVPAVYQQPLLHASSESKRIHNVRFTPVGDPGDEIPLEVFYCDVPVGEGPYMLKLLPEVDVYNLTLKNDLGGVLKNIRAKKNARLMLDGSNCGYVKTLQADVLGPDGCSRECTIEPHENKGLFIITFPVDMAGKYKIASSINGISSPPQFVDILPVAAPEDAVLKTPLNLQDCHIPLNVSSSLTFELKDDPDLTLAIIPTVKDAVDIKRVSQKLPSGKLLEEVILTPLTPGVNSIAFFFGGIKVHQIDYNAVADLKPTPIRKESVDKFERNYSVAENTKPLQQLDFKFDISTNTSGSDNLDAFVTMPSGSRDVAQIIDNHDGSVLVKYQPKTHGQHELSIVQNGAAVNGSPLKFFVDAYGDGLATVYGPGLTNAVVGEPAHFTVCAKGSNAKELSVSIEGPAQSTIKIHDNKDGTCSVNWMPPVPGEYKVHVKLGNHEVKESPFRVLVAGTGQKRAHLSVGSTSEVALSINNAEIKGVSASIKSPSGIDEPCLVRLIDGGKLGVSFTPREAGEHLITVKRDGKLVSKAPFKIKVEKSQVGDASKVEVTGKGKASAVCLQENEIIVDTTKAGYGGLSVSVQGPSKAELTCKEVKAGLIKVLYKPTEPGVYAIAVKFADHHVKDSPLTVNCTGKGAGTIQSLLKKKTEQAPMCLPNQEAVLYMKLANCSPMDTTARIMDPKGKTEDVEMRDTGSNFYLIKFRPAMEGVHNLSILHRDSHVNGSPFQFTVGSFKEGGAHKVRASGLGVVRGETNSKQYFNIYTREAGAGDLSVSIEGPSKPSFEFKDHKDGNCHVEYQVATPGEYNVSIKFNDVHIADSPFKVFIAAATGEARKLELASFHDQIPTGKAFTFTVLTHRARGHLEAKVTTPSHLTETIDIVPIEEGESYALRFIPKESGNHYIHVTLDGAPMRDSPFRIRVGGADLSDPTAIHAEGEGLVSGETGHKCEFVIKTVNAGSGVLTCQIDGPSKVTLDAYETTQGYKVRYTPLAPGDYFAAVKYNGVHIPGSPFKIVIDGKVLGGNGYNESSEVKVDARAKTSQGNVATVPEYKGDASKVVAKGAGLNKFFPGRPSVFTIDTGLAGTNLLMVGVVTTKGPCDEVIVKHQGNGHYAVNYRIPDRVKGFVFIKYGDQEIPGSPFSISP